MSPASVLPSPLTRFVGRDRELEEVCELLGTSRLVTLTGSAGSGKTRLALEATRRIAERFEHGIRWVELGPLSDPAFLESSLREAIGATDTAITSHHDAIVQAVRGKHLLLILDNCEHLVDPCAHLVDDLLRTCPELGILATSRRALGLAGEVAWLVPGLSVPPPEAAPGPSAVSAYESVRLFETRAQAVVPGFAVTEQNGADVAAICRRLDGVPLALEFAAARLHALSPAEVAERLDDRFRLLAAGPRTALPRHRTMRAAIDWSYELLTEHERLLLDRLSIFSGTFSLEAAEEVCGFGALEHEDVLDVVSLLVEASLLDVVERDKESRYRLSETLRQYAGERLAESGEAEALAHRHFSHFSALVEANEPELVTPRRPQAVDRLNRDFDNLHDALLWSRREDAGHHLALVGRLAWFWLSTGRWTEGRQWLEGALDDPGAATPTDRARALFGAGLVSTLGARPSEGRAWLLEALSIVEELGDERQEAYVRTYLGFGLTQDGHAEGKRHLQRAVELFERHGDLYGLRVAYLDLGFHALHTGAVAESISLAEKAVAAARAFGGARELGVALQCLGLARVADQDPARAIPPLRESAALLALDRNALFLARSCDGLGAALILAGQAEPAAALFGAASALRGSIGVTGFRLDGERVETAVARARVLLGEARFDAAWAEGALMGMEEATAFALSCAGSAESVVQSRPETEPLALHVRALGPLEIRVGGAAVSFPYAKARELLVYLACHPEGRTRHEIGAALWPKTSPARVKNNFHVTLHRLRRAIGRPDVVVQKGKRYQLAPHVDLHFDGAQLEEIVARSTTLEDAAKIAELEAALASYRGSFLEGEEANDWHLEPRERWRAVYLGGLSRLAEERFEKGRYQAAAEILERIVAEEDLHDGAHHRLMLSYARMGDPSRGRRHYEALALRRRHQLDEEPEPHLRDLYRTLSVGATA